MRYLGYSIGSAIPVRAWLTRLSPQRPDASVPWPRWDAPRSLPPRCTEVFDASPSPRDWKNSCRTCCGRLWKWRVTALAFCPKIKIVRYQTHEYLAEIKLHARQRLAKCPDLSFGHGWKSYHIGFGRENADHFLRFLQHADLLRFGRAKVLHQGKHFLMAQGLPGSETCWKSNRIKTGHSETTS